jgi:hypothetical protein
MAVALPGASPDVAGGTRVRGRWRTRSLGRLLTQLGAQPGPDTFVHWATIKTIPQETRLPCAAMLHFTAAAYRIIGARYADVFDRLTRRAEAC